MSFSLPSLTPCLGKSMEHFWYQGQPPESAADTSSPRLKHTESGMLSAGSASDGHELSGAVSKNWTWRITGGSRVRATLRLLGQGWVRMLHVFWQLVSFISWHFTLWLVTYLKERHLWNYFLSERVLENHLEKNCRSRGWCFTVYPVDAESLLFCFG